MKIKSNWLSPLLILLLFGGCRSFDNHSKLKHMKQQKENPSTVDENWGVEASLSFQEELPTELTVENLTQWYLQNSSTLRSLRKKVEVLHSSIQYSGALPNPIFSAMARV